MSLVISLLWWCEMHITQIPNVWTFCSQEIYVLSPYTETGKYHYDRFIPHTQNWTSSNFYHVIIFRKINFKKRKRKVPLRNTLSRNIFKVTEWSVNLHISKITKSVEERWLLIHLINLSNFLVSQNTWRSTLHAAACYIDTSVQSPLCCMFSYRTET